MKITPNCYSVKVVHDRPLVVSEIIAPSWFSDAPPSVVSWRRGCIGGEQNCVVGVCW